MAPEPSLPIVPAPWSLSGLGWTFLTHTPFSETPIPLPEGAYSPLEKGSTADQSSRFHGGLGVCMLVRYTDSDAGPYDELICVPGYFSTPDDQSGPSDKNSKEKKKEYHLSITRIYLSTAASVMNGRKNWGIPKHLANFNFTPKSNNSNSPISVSISLPNSSQPFFAATLTPSKFTPFLPIKTSWMDLTLSRWLLKGFKFELIQPPLPSSTSSDSYELEGEKDALVASEKTYLVKPTSGAWSKISYITPCKGEEGLEEYGNGVDFPKVRPVMGGRGIGVTGLRMTFPVPVEV